MNSRDGTHFHPMVDDRQYRPRVILGETDDLLPRLGYRVYLVVLYCFIQRPALFTYPGFRSIWTRAFGRTLETVRRFHDPDEDIWAICLHMYKTGEDPITEMQVWEQPLAEDDRIEITPHLGGIWYEAEAVGVELEDPDDE